MLNCAWKRSLVPLTAPFLAPNQATLHFVDSKLDERCNPWMAMDENGTTNTKQLDLMILHMIPVGFLRPIMFTFLLDYGNAMLMDPVVLSYLKHHPFLGHFVNSGCRALCLKKERASVLSFLPKHVCILHSVISSSGLLKDACCSSCCFNCLRFTSFTAKRSIRSSGVSPILSFTGWSRLHLWELTASRPDRICRSRCQLDLASSELLTVVVESWPCRKMWRKKLMKGTTLEAVRDPRKTVHKLKVSIGLPHLAVFSNQWFPG